jgi:hypothetical protein
LIRLAELITRDDWLPPKRDDQTTLLAYAQSWALFHMLMRDRPRALETYFRLISSRPTSDRRLPDFEQAFGRDANALEHRHGDYVRELVGQFDRTKR